MPNVRAIPDKLAIVVLYDPVSLEKIGVDPIRNQTCFGEISTAERAILRAQDVQSNDPIAFCTTAAANSWAIAELFSWVPPPELSQRERRLFGHRSLVIPSTLLRAGSARMEQRMAA